MFPTSTPSTKRDLNYPTSTPLNQVYPQDNTNVNTNANSNNFTPSGQTSTARTYKTRERLYYETEYVKAPNSPINKDNDKSNLATSGSTSLFEPFVRKNHASGQETNDQELPPTASLHEYLLSGGASNSPATNSNTPSTSFNNIAGSPMVINGVIGSPLKKTQPSNMEGITTQWSSVLVSGGPQQMTRSITVFGFPPNNRNDVLLSFQTHGTIETYDLGEGNNWLHITYESEWAAQKALARNGSIFQPIGVMVGVIPMQNALEKVSSAANSFMSPLKLSTTKNNTRPITEEPVSIFKTTKKTSNYNPLSSNDISSLPADSSIVTKAVNCIFGW